MTTTVIVTNSEDNTEEKHIVAKTICSGGATKSNLLKPGQSEEFTVYDGQGLSIERVSSEAPDPNAVVLTDEVAVEDSAA